MNKVFSTTKYNNIINSIELVNVTSNLKTINLKSENNIVFFTDKNIILNINHKKNKITNPCFMFFTNKDLIKVSSTNICNIYILGVNNKYLTNYYVSLSNDSYIKTINLLSRIYTSLILNEDLTLAYDLNELVTLINKFNTSNTLFNNNKELSNWLVKYIINNYNKQIKLEDISKTLGISESTICHVFKKQTGQSIIDYKIDLQLENSYNIIRSNNNYTTKKVSEMVGFNTTSYFIKKYKEKYNETPLETKNNLTNKNIQSWFSM